MIESNDTALAVIAMLGPFTPIDMTYLAVSDCLPLQTTPNDPPSERVPPINPGCLHEDPVFEDDVRGVPEEARGVLVLREHARVPQGDTQQAQVEDREGQQRGQEACIVLKV